MRVLSKFRAVLGGLIAAAALGASPALAGNSAQAMAIPIPKGEFAVVYDVYFGGIWAGEIVVDADVGPASYRAWVDFRTTGIVKLVYDSVYRAETTGSVGPDGLLPAHFSSDSRDDGDERTIEMSFADGSPRDLRVQPPYGVKPWSIKAQDQFGAADPLTASLAAFGPAPEDKVCGRTTEIFDGRYRYAIEIGPAQRKGDLLRCKAAYVRLAGYKPKWQGDKARSPFTLEFAPRGDGLYHTVRAVADTDFGAAVIVMRD